MTTNRTIFSGRVLSLLACSLLVGCAGPSQPATYPVRGTVRYEGKPIANASVSFLAPGAPAPAVGTTDDAGRFQLTTFQPNDGAIPGEHVVTVRKLSDEVAMPIAPPETADAAVDPAAIERAMQQTAQQMQEARSELPAKYADRATSDLRFEVAAGENEFKILLVD